MRSAIRLTGAVWRALALGGFAMLGKKVANPSPAENPRRVAATDATPSAVSNQWAFSRRESGSGAMPRYAGDSPEWDPPGSLRSRRRQVARLTPGGRLVRSALMKKKDRNARSYLQG